MMTSYKLKKLPLVLAPLLAATALAATSPSPGPIKSLSLTQLEERLATIDTELARLARFSLRSGAGSIGYRSRIYDSANEPAWVEIHFEREALLDELILVPAIRRDTETDFQSDGFPEAFKVLAGKEGDAKGHVIATVTSADAELHRIAPFVIPTPGVTASWIRIECVRLSTRAIDGHFALQFAEILAFSGQENVALHRELTTSPNRFEGGFAWDARYATDGFMPYLMNSAQGKKSKGYLSNVSEDPSFNIGPHPFLTIDLQESHPISRIQLHPLSLGDTIPHSVETSIGFPQHLQIEVATQFDFSDAKLLLDFKHETPYDLGPIMMWNLPTTTCRYVRLTALKPYIYKKGILQGPRIGFAEIEIFSEGVNVALGKVFSANFKEEPGKVTPLNILNDGLNLYGVILPIREWLNQLAQRHDLETERPLVIAELNRRYAQQKINLQRMIRLSILLVVGIGFTILFDRMLRIRQIARIKERFAADLHDELGANLHTIGLLSDLAEEYRDDPDEHSIVLRRIRAVTKQTGTAMRHCSDLMEADELYSDMRSDMNRAAQRIMANFEYDIVVDGEEHVARLNQRTRTDLFLFYKECLINVLRHSGATGFNAEITATPKEIQLTVQDNGTALIHDTPPSLQRRAKLLRATVSISAPAAGGNRITLTLHSRKRLLKKYK